MAGGDHKRKRDDNPNHLPDNQPTLPVLPPLSNSGAQHLNKSAPSGDSNINTNSSTYQNGPTSNSHPTTHSKARPKRSRNKADKKVEVENPSRFHCDYCNRDLSSAIRARCAVCPDYDSCLDCLSVGAALSPHKSEHAYRLIAVVHSPLFQEGWSAEEEDKLLEGLELWGLGNWEQVSKLVGTKNPVDTEEHFMTTFLGSPYAPLADPSKLVTLEQVKSEVPEDVDPKMLRVMHMHQQDDAAGWMEKRQDFVYEWDNEAEDLIGDMEITEDDSKTDKDLKSQVLEIYASKLDERDRRKEFVLKRGMTQFKVYQAAEKKRPKDERDLREKLRVFMRFLPQADMEKFIKGLIEEKQLRHKIDILREGRAHGASSVEECMRMTNSSKTKSKNSITLSDGGSHHLSSGSTSHRRRRSAGDSINNSDNKIANGATGIGGGTGGNSTSAPTATDTKERKNIALGEVDIELAPGAELLSRTEITLCKSLKISPHQYMIVKELIIRESARTGQFRKKDAKSIIRLDTTKVNKIFDYLQSCGWVKTGSTSGAGGNNNRPPVAGNATTPNGTKA